MTTLIKKATDFESLDKANVTVAPPTQPSPTAGNWIAAEDVKKMARQLDVAMNGTSGAAPSLCDVVSQAVAKFCSLAQTVEPALQVIGMRDGVYRDSTPRLHVGSSSFEDWFQAHEKACAGDKQLARDAYAAGMGDPLVTYAKPVQPAPDWLTAINELYEKITPLPWGGAADGRGVGLRGNRWTANGGFSDVCKKSVSRHGGTHFDNIRFMEALANAWPIIQAAIAQPVPPVEPDMPAIFAALGFDPTNHHNAARCPYCDPSKSAQPVQPAAIRKGGAA